jgi:hypothetical protein
MSLAPRGHTEAPIREKEMTMTMKIVAAALLAVSVLTSMAGPGIADDAPWTAERFWDEHSRRQF